MTDQLSDIAIVAAPLPVLDKVQNDVLLELTEGSQDKFIARKLGLSLEKVKSEEKKLRTTLYARSRCHLVAIALRYGLIENPNPYPQPTPPGTRKAPYAFYVLPRNTLEQPLPHPSRVIAVVAIKPPLWSIRRGPWIRSTSGTWDEVPPTFTPEWLANHTWVFDQVFNAASELVREEQAATRRR